MNSNSHDFGAYLSVVCHYDERFPQSIEYTFRCEAEMPEHWDDEARRELAAKERR